MNTMFKKKCFKDHKNIDVKELYKFVKPVYFKYLEETATQKVSRLHSIAAKNP